MGTRLALHGIDAGHGGPPSPEEPTVVTRHQPLSRFLSSALALSLAILPIATPAASADEQSRQRPAMEVDGTAVQIAIPSPGGRLILFGFAQEERHHLLKLVRYEEVLYDLDGDGLVALELPGGVPEASVWVGLDPDTGDDAVAAPGGRALRELVLPATAIPDTLDRLDLTMPMAEILVLRPGVGVWGMRAGDGGASDADLEADGTLRAALAEMWPVADSPLPPATWAPGDVLVVVDPQDLRLVIVRLTA